MNPISNKIDGLIGDFGLLIPEGVLVLGAIVLLISELIWSDKKAMVKTVLSLLVLVLSGWLVACYTIDGDFLNGIFGHNQIVKYIKYVLLVATACIFIFPNSSSLHKKGEYHFLVLMVLLGSFFVMQSKNLLLFYIAVELISISSYVLITFSFGRKGYEAGIKYLLFGAMASGLMLYGISLIYGLTGGLDIADLLIITTSQVVAGTWLNLALIFFFVGLLFKLAVVPMHVWTPDAYEAGPTPVVTLISILPKVAVLFFFFQFIQYSGLENISFDWKKILGLLAVISMFFGNLSALKQSNAKRMMAYSSIAHSGFLLLGVMISTGFAFHATLFYAVVYALMNLGAFYFIAIMERSGLQNIEDFSGTGKKNPILAVLIVIIMVSLVGLPPTGGFTAKILIFSSLWEYSTQHGDTYLLWVFGLGIMNAAISLFYYLKIPYFMIMKKGSDHHVEINPKDLIYLVLITFLILFIFFKADLLLNVLNQINFGA